jgi:hypothetical protein
MYASGRVLVAHHIQAFLSIRDHWQVQVRRNIQNKQNFSDFSS